MLIHHYVEYYARNYPDVSCITLSDRTVNYAEFNARTNRLAYALIATGVAKGDRVAILGRNSIEHVMLVIAAAKIGAVMVSLNWRLAVDELDYILKDARAKVLIALDEILSETTDALSERLGASVRVFSPSKDNSVWEDWLAPHPENNPECLVAPEDICLQLYTSGTTGRPKGVMASHFNVLSQFQMNTAALAYRPSYGEVELVTAPLFHIGGIGSVVIPLCSASHILLHQEFDPQAIINDLHEYGVKGIFMVPAMIAAVLSVPECRSKPFVELKQIYYGASPISESLLKEAMEVFGADFVQMYGMTETTGTIATLSAEDHKQAVAGKPELLRSCGRPSVGAFMKIIGEDGSELPDGDVGEFCIKADCNMVGYYNLPDKTEETLIDGWIHTGDAGYRDAEGYFYIKDRMKDMVVTGGENVYPAEVENVLDGHERVREVAVIGIPDEKYGEALLAVVATVDGKELPVEEMVEYCRGKIAGYKIPRQNKLVDLLPRNPSGKVLKTVLREPYWANVDRNVG